MQYDIPVKLFPKMLESTGVFKREDINTLEGFVENDDLQGFFGCLQLLGFGLDNEDQGKSCKGVKVALDVPDELESHFEVNQYKSIW